LNPLDRGKETPIFQKILHKTSYPFTLINFLTQLHNRAQHKNRSERKRWTVFSYIVKKTMLSLNYSNTELKITF
jgi:hypothetical protein